MKASIIKRVEKLEEQLKPSEPKPPPFDYDLLIESERAYFSKELTLLRTKARELGYGDKNNKVSWFDLRGCDPVWNEEVRMECLEALNDEEMQIIETFHKIVEKGCRLTAILSEDEKAIVKKYNHVVTFFGNSLMMNAAEKGWSEGHAREELEELRVLYEQIMAKHGERIYE
ncbi:MAG: hypothetical protein OEW62_02895 [Candidatus Bathyarchaeota archaeon]|nr:hypothetical protein [Candidatus Bathyarchaeota archaeon]MDH5595738.1 hypothetical protein [Candidatus Bathyarchaeota archaeon]